MDRALKERTIGAIVLVAFIVLVVPVFLDGPVDEPATVSESVTLPGQTGQPRKRQTIVLERDRSEPVPVSSAGPEPETPADDGGSPAAGGNETPEPVPEPVADTRDAEAADTPPPGDAGSAGETAADEEPAPAAATEPAAPAPAAPSSEASATGMWAVQLGSFSNKDNAERLAAELRGEGFAAFLSQLDSAGGPLHRVRVGPQKDRDSAESMAGRLSAAGHNGQVVPHP